MILLCVLADNWLLSADQRSLILTDFGAAVDALRPKRRMCSSWPAAPIPQSGAVTATNGTGPGEARDTFASINSGPSQSTRAASNDAPRGGAAGAASGEGGKSGDANKKRFPAPTTARCEPTSKRVLPASKRSGSTDSTALCVEGGGDVSAASPARKRRRHCGHEESGSRSVDPQAGYTPEVSPTRLSDQLLFPFSKYCVTGTPSILAPELARAWREEKDLDFRRSDVSLCWLSSKSREYACVPYRPRHHPAPLR